MPNRARKPATSLANGAMIASSSGFAASPGSGSACWSSSAIAPSITVTVMPCSRMVGQNRRTENAGSSTHRAWWISAW